MRVARVIPNHALTSRGRDEKGASDTARSKMGSVGLSESSMARTVERTVSERAAHQLERAGMYRTEGWCLRASTKSCTTAASGVWCACR